MMARGEQWDVDASKILSKRELHEVLQSLHRKRRSVTTRMKRAIVRLACCCGLRVSEIAGLRVDDIRLGDWPHVRVRREVAKGKKPRKVPLDWDEATKLDLLAWQAERLSQGAAKTDPLICSQRSDCYGQPLTRFAIRAQWQTALRGALPADRVAELSIHAGRHTFVSHALAGGQSLPAVRKAAGHSSLSTTSIYTHVAEDLNGGDTPGTLFAYAGPPPAPSTSIERRIIELRRQGLSLQRIADQLNADGIKTPQGKRFAKTQVHRLLEKAGVA